jgi:hypothetical protein
MDEVDEEDEDGEGGEGYDEEYFRDGLSPRDGLSDGASEGQSEPRSPHLSGVPEEEVAVLLSLAMLVSPRLEEACFDDLLTALHVHFSRYACDMSMGGYE